MKQILITMALCVVAYAASAQQLPQVVINEVMAINDSLSNVSDPNGQHEDFIELFNKASTPANLTGYYITDSYLTLNKWQFPSGTAIGGNGYLVIWCDKDSSQAGLHASFKLNGTGEQVALSNPNLSIVDSVSYGAQFTNLTYGRIPNGTGAFALLTPTVGANNNSAASHNIIARDFIETFPNPANDILSVRLKDMVVIGSLNVNLYDSNGRLVLSNPLENNQTSFNVATLSAGTYIVEIKGNSAHLSVPVMVHH